MAEYTKAFPRDLTSSEKSDSSIGSAPAPTFSIETNPALDRKLLWRRDIVLIPISGVLYMLLFLVRTNIANARALGIGSPTGLEGFLGMPTNGYNVALAIFYIPFVLAEVPANITLTYSKIPPRLLVGVQMAILGVLGMCQGFIKSYGGFLAIRFIMGIFEASLPAGAALLVSRYYTKRESTMRFSFFLSFALIGPFFSGLLAYAINNLEGAGGYHGWQWIFIIEGLTTIVLAIPVILFLPDFPEKAQNWFLKPDERARIVHMLETSRGMELKGSAAEDVPLWKVLIDWRIHLFTMCFFCCDITASSVSAFMPTILTELGWTSTVAQLMTMPIWAVGIVASFAATIVSRHYNFRAPVVVLAICFQLVGWIIMRAYASQASVRYMALYFLSVGTFAQMPLFMGWLSDNLRGQKYLAVGMAWIIGFGNCANFGTSNVFVKTESPRYPTGFTVGLVFTIIGLLLTVLGCTLLAVSNRRREALRAHMSDAEREAYDQVHFEFAL